MVTRGPQCDVQCCQGHIHGDGLRKVLRQALHRRVRQVFDRCPIECRIVRLLLVILHRHKVERSRDGAVHLGESVQLPRALVHQLLALDHVLRDQIVLRNLHLQVEARLPGDSRGLAGGNAVGHVPQELLSLEGIHRRAFNAGHGEQRQAQGVDLVCKALDEVGEKGERETGVILGVGDLFELHGELVP